MVGLCQPGLHGAVNEYNQASKAPAASTIQMSTFDGRGFADKAFHDRRCLRDAGRPGVSTPVRSCKYRSRRRVVCPARTAGPHPGGFHTHYRRRIRLADPNVETTSLALLALLNK
ncbi:MAG: hypothetical protein R2873_27315 [Caldilineaceae bacterium]